MKHGTQLELEVLPQPDDSTCGPTCLHALYRYYQRDMPLEQVIAEVTPLPEGGTLAVYLACHALRRGFEAEIYTYNLQLFDPTWFASDVSIAERLRAQSGAKRSDKLRLATRAYLEFLELGGKLEHRDLTPALIRGFLKAQTPILTGLSATYLYQCTREYEDRYDDVRGRPTGHFVVLSGYDRETKQVMLADPLHDNPLSGTRYYSVDMSRLIGAILLGIVTYDANLLVILPPNEE